MQLGLVSLPVRPTLDQHMGKRIRTEIVNVADSEISPFIKTLFFSVTVSFIVNDAALQNHAMLSFSDRHHDPSPRSQRDAFIAAKQLFLWTR